MKMFFTSASKFVVLDIFLSLSSQIMAVLMLGCLFLVLLILIMLHLLDSLFFDCHYCCFGCFYGCLNDGLHNVLFSFHFSFVFLMSEAAFCELSLFFVCCLLYVRLLYSSFLVCLLFFYCLGCHT